MAGNHVTREEFEAMNARISVLENEVTGEKLVTRHVLAQANLNADDLAVLMTGVRKANSDLLLANTALASIGTRMTVIDQHVTHIGNEVTALRRGQEEIHARLDVMHTEVMQAIRAIRP